MNDTSQKLTFSASLTPPHFYTITVQVPQQYVDSAYHHAARALQKKIDAHGFSKGTIPLNYVKHNYQNHLYEHIKKFLFHYVVIGFLFKKLHEQKIVLLGEPRLTNVRIELGQPATFEFECTTAPHQFAINPWKHLPFKAPGRKHYRDIDRQVEAFIQEEQERQSNMKNHNKVAIGDIICFNIWVVDDKQTPLLNDIKEILWLKIGNEEGDILFQQLFVDKMLNETFYTQSIALQEYFSDKLEQYATFGVQIITILPAQYVCFDSLKEHFRIKTGKDLRRKLIEVFSFRNDVSQRRLMAEGTLSLLIKHHPLHLPHHALLRKQQSILNHLSMNPDYPVYKMEQDFAYKVEQLALRQLKEAIIIDKIAYDENISITQDDIGHYLNLTKRPRTKEFIYFSPPSSKLNGQETPIPVDILKHYTLREKTLNNVIIQLTKH